MDKLKTEKESARSKGDARRKKFQAQDSVLNETFNASQAWYCLEKIHILIIIYLPGLTTRHV